MPLKGTGGNIDSPEGRTVRELVTHRAKPSAADQSASGHTCEFLGSSVASEFQLPQLFFGTWRIAHLKSFLRTGSVELQNKGQAS